MQNRTFRNAYITGKKVRGQLLGRASFLSALMFLLGF